MGTGTPFAANNWLSEKSIINKFLEGDGSEFGMKNYLKSNLAVIGFTTPTQDSIQSIMFNYWQLVELVQIRDGITESNRLLDRLLIAIEHPKR